MICLLTWNANENESKFILNTYAPLVIKLRIFKNVLIPQFYVKPGHNHFDSYMC